MATLSVSVILCTHNPKPQYVSRVLDSLARQTLDKKRWELLIIDNASEPPLNDSILRGSLVNSRIIRADRLGLTNARLKGFEHASAPLIVMVDDDNVLAADYLETGLCIGSGWEILGAWGGQCLPEFEIDPPAWTQRYWNWLAIRVLEKDLWSNLPMDSPAEPYGAGMWVRRVVAEHYRQVIARRPEQIYLDRVGGKLLGGGDTELCRCAYALGLGVGIFRALRLTHIIPRSRLEESYLLELVESMTYSHTLLSYFAGRPQYLPSRSERLLRWYQRLYISSRERRFARARERGLRAAVETIERLKIPAASVYDFKT